MTLNLKSRRLAALAASLIIWPFGSSSWAQSEQARIAGVKEAEYILMKTQNTLKEKEAVQWILNGHSVAFKLFCENSAHIILVINKMPAYAKQACDKKGITDIVESEIDGGGVKLTKYVNNAKMSHPVAGRWNNALK